MDETIPCDDCGFPMCDVEGLDGLYLYPKGYTNNNNTNDAEEEEEEEEEKKEDEAVSNLMPSEWFTPFNISMPIFNKPHNHLFLGFYYSTLYLTVKNVKSIVRNFTLRWSNFIPCLIINLQVEDEIPNGEQLCHALFDFGSHETLLNKLFQVWK